jgi:hypothetical protein
MIPEHLQRIEQQLGFEYPESFVSMLREFAGVFDTEGFNRAFPDTRLLNSTSEIAKARLNIPVQFIPFMLGQEDGRMDIYAFDLESEPPEYRVVVWADHAVVMSWPNFPIFVRWAHGQITSEAPSA